MAQKDPLLRLAERVAEEANKLGIETAIIGAAALAVHGYERATLDLDLASAVDPTTELRELEKALLAMKLHTRLNLPDADDALGGVLNVWETEDEAKHAVEMAHDFVQENLADRIKFRDEHIGDVAWDDAG